MSSIERARELLQKWPNLVYRETANSITVDAQPQTGFSISFHAARNEFVVSFDGWHDHFETESDALKCFEFGLVGPCRLKVYRRWKMEYRWTLERFVDDRWEECSTSGLLIFPFWGRREIIYRQNGNIHPKS